MKVSPPSWARAKYAGRALAAMSTLPAIAWSMPSTVLNGWMSRRPSPVAAKALATADTSPAALEEAGRTRETFEEYRRRLSEMRDAEVLDGELPRDPEYLSYSLAATCLLTLAERQSLLESATAVERLVMLRHLLTEEMRAMQAIPSLPATEVARTSWSPN